MVRLASGDFVNSKLLGLLENVRKCGLDEESIEKGRRLVRLAFGRIERSTRDYLFRDASDETRDRVKRLISLPLNKMMEEYKKYGEGRDYDRALLVGEFEKFVRGYSYLLEIAIS